MSQADEVHLDQLRAEPFVIFPRHVGPGLYDSILSLCSGAGFVPQVTQEVEQMAGIVGLVGAGLGVSLVPESIRLIQAPGVVYRPLRPTTMVELGLARRRNDPSSLLAAFLAVAGLRDSLQ